MTIDRRQLLAGMGGAAILGLPLRSPAATSATIGTHEVLSVSDGNLVLPGAFFFDGLPQDEVDSILTPLNISKNQLEPPCNVTLVRHENRVILFDAGSGDGFMPSAGDLVDSLDAVGVAPEDVTHLVFTHGHPDHLWGVLDDFDDPVFADAEHMIGQTEWTYWTDPNTVSTIGDARAAFAVGAARRLEIIAERMTFFDDGEEILPGIMAHASFGHTPGHMAFEVRSGSNALLIGGDAIGNHHIAFARPDWASGSDQDPDLAAKTRARLLDKLVNEDIALLGFHLPDGGVGRVERKDSSYRFVAEDL
ncbi:MBL fold metallo-hydrolase [Litoreibacter janthinus]|uniref:Glyoxylase, beta-lactamase superfamily II n=1 Tax=Litoreibacter janthinus TaxID=670154 RepID=A0A1I6FR30_9RHOB|nr:MBL fold metallo-hydrolase [Litoreibacter janthinus]SFR32354.1 Glyoxylase, beta-lactamase superfamily II [Litoreibacter janthinus]